MKVRTVEIKARSRGHIRVRDKDYWTVEHENLCNEDYSGREYRQFVAVGARFERCRFDKLHIESGCFGAGKEMSEYIDCSFNGARMLMGPGGYARFVRCSFLNVELSDWFCFAVELVDCVFSGRIHKAIFNGTVRADMREVVHRTSNEFHGNDFSAVKLEDVAFRTGIDLMQQRLPVGVEYLYLPDAESAIQRTRVDVMGWRDLELRRLAMGMIKSLEDELLGGQHQLLLRLDDYPRSTRQSDKAVFDLLRSHA